MSDTAGKIEAYYANVKNWPEEERALRAIVKETELTETWKWRSPIYTFNDANLVAVAGYKESAVLSFFKGVLLKDEAGLLQPPGPNSRSARVARFTSIDEIEAVRETLKAYVAEAIELEKKGVDVDLPDDDFDYPEELIAMMEADPDLHDAFEGLTPGRRRGWVLHFSGAKQPATRISRIEKARDKILAGKGMHDR
ncbi:MAG: YdeI/OmpD-associated family protein [Henriciella sp.]